MFSMSVAVRDTLAASAMGMHAPSAETAGSAMGQVGLQYMSERLGMLKAELGHEGQVTVGLQAFQPLPMLVVNTELQFAGGMPQPMSMVNCMTGLGPLMLSGSYNLFGLWSTESVLGTGPIMVPKEAKEDGGEVVMEPTGHQVLMGVHCWGTRGGMLGLPAQYLGLKAAVEWAFDVVENEELKSQCAITAAVTRPRLSNDGSPGKPSFSLSVCHRDPESTLALQYERSAGASEGVLSVGASRQLSDSQRLKGRCTTQGILGVALETAGEKHIISFVGEVDAQLARGSASALNPKCGVNLQLSL